jgi:hypothetical protein
MNRLASSSSRLNWSLLGFAFSLFIPSTGVLQKYLGTAGVVSYIVVASLTLLLFVRYRFVITKLASTVTERQVVILTAVTFAVILIAFVVGYPIANSGIVGGGSDCDEALNTATTELLQGHYPYYPRTYLGNPISPLPGALLLAIPFVLLGNSAYQNLFWLLAYFIAIRFLLKDSGAALLLLWVIFALSPIVLYEFVTGSDYIANSLYVLLFVLWTIGSISRPHHSSWRKTLPAILLGISLSSRANFVLLLPLVFFALVQNAGYKSAIQYTALTCITFVAVTIPFYLYDPQGFSPLHTSGKLGQFESILPFAGIAIPLLTGFLALALSLVQPVSGNLNAVLRNCAIVLGFPVLCGIVLSLIKDGPAGFGFSSFGVFFLFWGALSFLGDFSENAESSMSRI